MIVGSLVIKGCFKDLISVKEEARGEIWDNYGIGVCFLRELWCDVSRNVHACLFYIYTPGFYDEEIFM